MADMVVLTTVDTRYEAEVLRTALAAAGIDSQIISDDCGAVDPALGFGRGTHLLVSSSDFEQAKEVLSAPTTVDPE